MEPMDLTELSRRARELYAGQPLTLSRLLLAWAGADRDRELTDLLVPAGLDLLRLTAALSPLLALPPAGGDELLTRCIMNETSQGPVTGRHLLRALCEAPDHPVTRALEDAGLDRGSLQHALGRQTPQGLAAVPEVADTDAASVLQEYGRELTAEAAAGEFDDLCHRPECEQLERVLFKRRGGSCVITGPAGVGKTALVELLARRIVRDEVAPPLQRARLFELSVGALLAGTSYRGQFEQRLQRVVAALRSRAPSLLFVDEVHLLCGAGRAEGVPLDADNMLKPLLARGEVRLIGATTTEEYRRHVAADRALARRLEQLPLQEPVGELLERMVARQASALEQHHQVHIPATICRRAVVLTDRHLGSRWQPDKSVDLLDSAAANLAGTDRRELREADLLRALSRQTGRCLVRPGAGDRAALAGLADRLREHVVGQDRAVDRVAASLICRRLDLTGATGTQGAFLLVGPRGVGKTTLGRAVAAELFSGGRRLLHLDMAEYSGPGAVHRLLGAPPGFAGADRDGLLTRWLHEDGGGVLLLDDIEKAHGEVRHLLPGLLDGGHLRSAGGLRLDARQCVVVLTSGALLPAELRRQPVGFAACSSEDDLVPLLERDLSSELLARLDEIIQLSPLDGPELRQILARRLREAVDRLAARGVTLRYEHGRLLDHLMAGLQRHGSGAWDVMRSMEARLIQPVARALLREPMDTPFTFHLGDTFYESGRLVRETAA